MRRGAPRRMKIMLFSREISMFEFYQPSSLSELLHLLEEGIPDTCLLAGGTDLLVEYRSGARNISRLIRLAHLSELQDLKCEDGRIKLGAALTYRTVERSSLLREKVPFLVQAAQSIGSPQVRNLGTIGGNLVTASPAGDLAPPLLVLEAQLTLKKKSSSREIPLSSFFMGPKRTLLDPQEVVTEISFALPPENCYQIFYKLGKRNAMAISIASLAALGQAQRGFLTGIKIAVGSVAPTPLRLFHTEGLLQGERLTQALLKEANRRAQEEISPIGDIRGSVEYRREMVGVLLERALSEIAGEVL
ncbi:FAD binding domain-containing protein [Candidatus Hakubella thermalkaliphila]|nr:xanthine dehydrogenase family protein subunit M [Candidatus Hakubella thermalkaliphila]